MAHHKTVLIERIDNGPGVGASFCVRPGSRSRPFIWWSDDDVPDFARNGGRFIIERIPGSIRPTHRIVGPAPDNR